MVWCVQSVEKPGCALSTDRVSPIYQAVTDEKWVAFARPINIIFFTNDNDPVKGCSQKGFLKYEIKLHPAVLPQRIPGLGRL